MPVLDWIGKQAVVNHHREVPYRLVHCDGDLSAGDAGQGNLLVQGDNLQALKALLPYYAGRVNPAYSPNTRFQSARERVGDGFDLFCGFGTASRDGSGVIQAADG